MNENIFLKEYKKLNSHQKEAVEAIEGPVMVIAGPGTGKTQIIAMRIANILRKTQTNPSNILCLTFTNSGVRAMKKRLFEIIGPPSYQIQIHTFHSFCNEVIVQFPEKFLFAKTINQLNDLEIITIIQNVISSHEFKFIKPFKAPFHYQNVIISSISKLKQENITPDIFKTIIEKQLQDFDSISDLRHEKGLNSGKIKAKYLAEQNNFFKNKELAIIFNEYQKYLQKEGKYDYEDMILFVVSAFQKDEELLSHYQEQFQYILVDEYQDTNSAQNKLLQEIASYHDEPNLFVVGDDEQSIYRFQGASLENILFFTKLYPKAKIIVLTDNYRSGQVILDAARELIQNNKTQLANFLKVKKDIKSKITNSKSQIFLGEFTNGFVEYFYIGQKIKELIKEGVLPSQIAVLYRENRDAQNLVDLFSKLNIPFKLEVGENVLNDSEISKLITFLNILDYDQNANMNFELLEVMHYPFFKISTLDIYKISVEARKKKKNIFDILSSDSEIKSLKLDNAKAVKDFETIYLNSINIFFNNTFSTAFEKIINVTGFLDYLLHLTGSAHHLNRLQSLFEYIKLLNLKEKKLSLKSFLKHLKLLEENNLPISSLNLSAQFEGVNLLTAHKAKGLEFDYVFIIRSTDKHWGNNVRKELIKLPSELLITQIDSDENDEEERRLFYVALTRTKKEIYLTSAQSYSEAEVASFAIPSKFLGELPKNDLSIIKTETYEKEFEKRLKITFEDKKWHRSKALNDFLKELVNNFRLNPTALNTYLECPQRFFYDNILRVPKAKDFTQCYGTAVHGALEVFFKKYIKDLTLPNKAFLLLSFKEALTNEILSIDDLKTARSKGKNILSDYYDYYAKDWQKSGRPISCEYNFYSRNVYYDEIPITGVIDKIELMDSISNKVRIIDYKTSAPKSLNYLLGLTKQRDLSLFYQAYFYKLLSETDPLFNWQVGEIVFDFISDRGFKQVVLPIDDKKYQEFKILVKKTYHEIVKLKFPREPQSCKKRDRACDYYGICRSNLNKSS